MLGKIQMAIIKNTDTEMQSVHNLAMNWTDETRHNVDS